MTPCDQTCEAADRAADAIGELVSLTAVGQDNLRSPADVSELVDRLQLMAGQSAPPRDDLRRALREWTFSRAIRAGNDPPADLAPAIRWLEHNTVRMADLAGDQVPVLARRMLDRISRKQDGTVAAAKTANRKPMVVSTNMPPVTGRS
jgi:hypothetical protein